ncbi:hypothetical protein EDC94DRAFT_649594 [Helicostylum pulchrum]|nr:hypothetical protein EDC94DRAFT_649594 [Helicostylum pulchrum]
MYKESIIKNRSEVLGRYRRIQNRSFMFNKKQPKGLVKTGTTDAIFSSYHLPGHPSFHSKSCKNHMETKDELMKVHYISADHWKKTYKFKDDDNQTFILLINIPRIVDVSEYLILEKYKTNFIFFNLENNPLMGSFTANQYCQVSFVLPMALLTGCLLLTSTLLSSVNLKSKFLLGCVNLL